MSGVCACEGEGREPPEPITSRFLAQGPYKQEAPALQGKQVGRRKNERGGERKEKEEREGDSGSQNQILLDYFQSLPF